MDAKLLEYYKTLMAPPYSLSPTSLSLAAREYLILILPDMAPEYLETEPWNRLVLGLQANGAQLCAECYAVKPLAEFRRPLDLRSKCASCLDVVKLKRADLRNLRKKFQRADADARRSTPEERKAARRQILEIFEGLPGSPAVKRKLLEDQFGIRPRPGDRDLTESC